MDMNQMIPLLMAMMGGNQQPGTTPAAAPATPAANRIEFTRTVNLFRRQADKRMMVSVGDIVAPWAGPARAIKASDCVKGEKSWTTKNEWHIVAEIGQYGRARIVKAEDTGVEYARDDFDDFDDEANNDGFDDASKDDAPEGKSL